MTEDPDQGLREALSEQGISRRGLMKLAGAATAASASLGVAANAFAQEKEAATERAAAEAEGYERRQGRAKDSNAKAAALTWLDNNASKVTDLNDEVFAAAELSLREWQSALAHANLLRRQGFSIDWGTAGLPAAFIATYTNGHGGPSIGFNAEYDALPGISQKPGVGVHDPAVYGYDPYSPEYGAGHGCGHCALGSASTGAAIATAQALRKHGVAGTVKLYGSTGEEQLVGKVYAARAGAYKDLDAFIDWHPSPANATGWGSSSAMCSLAFTFLGQTSHGGAPTPGAQLGDRDPDDGLDARVHPREGRPELGQDALRDPERGPRPERHHRHRDDLGLRPRGHAGARDVPDGQGAQVRAGRRRRRPRRSCGRATSPAAGTRSATRPARSWATRTCSRSARRSTRRRRRTWPSRSRARSGCRRSG